ncbi:MAG: AMP-binding protein, partial [Thiohalospira sp.]
EALQLERLRHLLARVVQRVPYYRDWFRQHALTPDAFAALSDLRRLPVSDKAVMRKQGQRWLAEDADGLVAQRTSGSSGEPLSFWLGKDRVSMDIAAKWRATRWWDVDIGDRELVLWASPVETGAQDRVRKWRDRLMRSRLVPAQDMNPARTDRIIDEIRAFRPRMLFGYPSALARVAWRARERGRALDDLGIRIAFTTSEVLRPEWRRVISEVMGCAVANEYGARDAGFIARECPAGRLHVTAEALIIEVLDEHDQPVPAGETGEIVVTNLMGPEFPFIRYRTGDRGALDPEPCPCGRGLPVLRELQGRANDGLVAQDGAWVHGSRFNYLMRDLPGLKAYKIIQQTRTRVDVLVSIDAPLPAGFAERLGGAFAKWLGEGVELTLQTVDAIPPEANGKYRHVVCRVPDPMGTAPTPQQPGAMESEDLRS